MCHTGQFPRGSGQDELKHLGQAPATCLRTNYGSEGHGCRLCQTGVDFVVDGHVGESSLAQVVKGFSHFSDLV